MYFVHLLIALIECTCAVLEKVYVHQGHNYRQCSQRGGFVGKAGPVLLLFSRLCDCDCDQQYIYLGFYRIPYAISPLKMANLSLS